MLAKDQQQSRALDVNAAGAAWVFDVAGHDRARVSMAGVDGSIGTAQFTVYGMIDDGGKMATGEVLTPAAPVSDEIDCLTFTKLRVECTTGESAARSVRLTCVRAVSG